MPKIEFYKTQEQSWFLDPRENFARKSIAFEVRKDFLTGHVSRILPFRWKLPETKLDPQMIETSKRNCPFCPDQISSMTPKFLPDIVPEGRIQRGNATLIPNSFPYAQYSCVVILSKEHFLHLEELTADILTNGFLIAQEGIDRVRKKEPRFDYCSVNWNYLPQSGGGLFHPHLQVVVDERPTVSHHRVLEGLKNYRASSGNSYWEDWLLQERETGERYAGKQGETHFLMAFSPLGVLGEIFIIFADCCDIRDLTSGDWNDLAEGLTKIFKFFRTKHVESFNLALFSGGDHGLPARVFARLCPRAVIPPWNTSDVNYFEKLHDEVICVISPEEWCGELRSFMVDKI